MGSAGSVVVRDKFSGEEIARIPAASPADFDRAIVAADAARPAMRALAAFERQAILNRTAVAIEARRAEFESLLCAEAGKPIRDARVEVERAADTFRIAAEEAVRQGGEVLPLDRTPRGRGYTGFTRRVPIGACGFITPFNFPLNLAAHKVAPAIAAGCPFVLKPASTTPLTALLLADILREAGMPPGSFSVLPAPGRTAEVLAADPRIAKLSFTGSAAVGWRLKQLAYRKRVTLELGGNAACIVDEGTDVAAAAKRLAFGAFYQSGQSCVSVQRIIAHESLYGALRDALVAEARSLVLGDPRDEATFLGPMISPADAQRLADWIDAAAARGARLLCGGNHRGAMMEATLLEGVPADAELSCEEAFGPVAVLESFRDVDEALARVNASRFGLQAGIFTNRLDRAMRAWDVLEVGGVIVGDIPSWRADAMPYGGVKESGFGREGVRWAIEEMTELRLMAVKAL